MVMGLEEGRRSSQGPQLIHHEALGYALESSKEEAPVHDLEGFGSVRELMPQ